MQNAWEKVLTDPGTDPENMGEDKTETGRTPRPFYEVGNRDSDRPMWFPSPASPPRGEGNEQTPSPLPSLPRMEIVAGLFSSLSLNEER